MKAERYRCPACGFGHGRTERVCWDCRCKGDKPTVVKAPAPRASVGGWRCEGCGETFGGVGAFDEHRTGDFARSRGGEDTRRCLTDREMARRGLVRNTTNGRWGRPSAAGEEGAA